MTKGPPSSAAGPSRPPPVSQPPRNVPPAVAGSLPPQPVAQQPLTQSYYASASRPTNEPAPAARNQHYLTQPQWGNGWSVPGYSQSAQSAYRPQTAQVPNYPSATQQPPYSVQNYPRPRYTAPFAPPKASQKTKTPPIVPTQAPAPAPRSPSPPPPPSPKFRHWDRVIKDFLDKLGLKQALNGFESDILVMNSDFERLNVPGALYDLMQGIMLIRQGADMPLPEQDRSFEERKLDYLHTANPSSHTSITKSISAFLAQNRAKNDASNRAEFLQSLAKKRKRIDDEACRANPDGPVDRDVQMKYDIAKNTDGPLRRTTRQQAKAVPVAAPAPSTSTRPKTKQATRELKKAASPVVVKTEGKAAVPPHSGLEQRLGNIETHFSVQYVPAQPDNLLARLQFLEDHIIQLEKDYPPWAALHFNQPNRGWPPPPRATPIIVPPHLRSATSVSSVAVPPPVKAGGVKTKNTGSSLQRAVLDQLAMKEARSDLAGRR
ncbi:hypothetical protein B0H10DRAFT_2211725 [Mycena sp. CBHHK59/15]|nr:hypothetical protein B0H10DRAFT_2211725 [Mycena sp. CBHHK59/15]